jgi:hypothetical protein
MTYAEYIELVKSSEQYVRIVGTDLVKKVIGSSEYFNQIRLLLSDNKVYTLDEVELSKFEKMCTKTSGFRQYIKKRLPLTWITALKEQRVYDKYVELLYTSVNKTAILGESNSGFNKKYCVYRIINLRLNNIEDKHPLDLLNTDEQKAAQDIIDVYELNNRIDVINYNVR